MPLPNEIWLDVFACVDYGTLATGWFTSSRISRLIRCNKERLALHRRLSMRTRAGAGFTNDIIIELRDLDSGSVLAELPYAHDMADPHTDVLQRLMGKVVPHGLFELSVHPRDLDLLEKSLNILPGVKLLFDGLFPAEVLRLSKLELTVNQNEFDWTLLRTESLRRLPHFDLRVWHWQQVDFATDTREIVEYCFDFDLLPRDAMKTVQFRNIFFSLQFAVDIMLAAINDRSERLFKVAFETRERFELGPFEVTPIDLGNGRLRYARENPSLFLEIEDQQVMVTNDVTETTPAS